MGTEDQEQSHNKKTQDMKAYEWEWKQKEREFQRERRKRRVRCAAVTRGEEETGKENIRKGIENGKRGEGAVGEMVEEQRNG